MVECIQKSVKIQKTVLFCVTFTKTQAVFCELFRSISCKGGLI